ncbi:MAG: hypothetical protein ACI9CE_002241 [Flavobacterium sp.]|jgi:hypothetical protein
MMADKNVINFQDAKSPHVFKRQEDKVATIQKAFKAARADAEPIKNARNKKANKRGKNAKKKK